MSKKKSLKMTSYCLYHDQANALKKKREIVDARKDKRKKGDQRKKWKDI